MVPRNDDPVGKSSRRRRAPVIAAALALVSLAIVLVAFFSGRGRAGAASPTEAVATLTNVAEGGDAVELLNAFAPSEVAPYQEILTTVDNRVLDGRSFSQLIEQNLNEAGPAVTPEDLSYSFEVTEVEELERYDEVAVVEFDGYVTISVDAGSQSGETLDALSEWLEQNRRFDVERTADGYRFKISEVIETVREEFDIDLPLLRVVTVKEEGRWYVSWMLTVANLANTAAMGPEPEWDEVGQPMENGAESGSEAVEMFVGSVLATDVESLTTLVSRPWARIAQAFPDYVDNIETAWQAEGFSGELIELKLDDIGDDVYAVELLEARIFVDGSGGVIEIEQDCVTTDGDTQCMMEYAPDSVTNRSLLVATDTIDGRHVVEPTESLTKMFTTWLNENPPDFLRARLGLAEFDEAVVSTSFDEVNDLTFGDKPYVVLQIDDVELSSKPLAMDVEVEGGNVDHVELYINHMRYNFFGAPEALDRGAGSGDEPDSVQAVIFKDRGRCGPIYCEDDFTSDDEPFSATIVAEATPRA